MKNFLEILIKNLTFLPKVGPKSATSIANFLLKNNANRARAADLAASLSQALQCCKNCAWCQRTFFSHQEVCPKCLNNSARILCIVERQIDASCIEEAGVIQANFFVTHGVIDPSAEVVHCVDLNLIKNMIKEGGYSEVILALPLNFEGEYTATKINAAIKGLVTVSRIIPGIPFEAHFDHLSKRTMEASFANRVILTDEH